MERETRLVCALVSRLLAYPDEDSLRSLPELRAVPDGIPEHLRGDVREFLLYLEKTPLVALQEQYTGTFDLSPQVSLDLTYHRWGDDKQRSSALVELKRVYSDGGYECAAGELPDYLPMILEYLSVCPEGLSFPLWERYGGELDLIASRLVEMKSPYAKLLKVLTSALSEGEIRRGSI